MVENSETDDERLERTDVVKVHSKFFFVHFAHLMEEGENGGGKSVLIWCVNTVGYVDIEC